MIAVPVPPDEAERLQALRRYDVPGGIPQEAFGNLLRLATEALGMPMASINLMDDTRQLIQATLGTDGLKLPDLEEGRLSTPRATSLCAWTILTPEVAVVPDLRTDERFSDHGLVAEGVLRFYAGAPLVTPDGYRVGCLCVADSQVRDFGARERGILEVLAQLVIDELELRRREHELQQLARCAEVLAAVSGLEDQELSPVQMSGSVAELLNQVTALDWVSLIRVQEGRLQQLSEWSSGSLSFGAVDRTRRGASPSQGVIGECLRRQATVFVDNYSAHALALESLRDIGVGRVACLYLTDGGADAAPLLLLAVQMEHSVWTDSEQALFLAAGRSLRLAVERQQRLRDMQRAAYTDALTGLHNRRGFDEDVRALDQRGEQYCVVMVDLDGMKSINDAHGHAEGDLLLQSFGRQLSRGLPDNDRTYRLGGDEFALVLRSPLPDDAELGRQVQDRLAWAVHWTRRLGFPTIDASQGWASVPHQAAGGVAALELADQRMYRQKADHGRRNAENVVPERAVP